MTDPAELTKTWFEKAPGSEDQPTPGPCPSCGREAYKTRRRLQQAWVEAGTATCPTCIRAYHKPITTARSPQICPTCGRRVRTAGQCPRCKEEGHMALRLDV